MKESTDQLLARAVDAIEAAEILLTNGKAEIAAGRAYYAMFYVAEALLNEKGFQFGKHGNVLAAYGQHFAKTKVLDPKYHRWLIAAFAQRQIGDYGIDPDIQSEVVVEMIRQAQEFLDTARRYLASL
ncbi:MAG: HEPN domain-containing protein [Anaerolineaceae bacterium]|nr:MAG: HEPN domain-containing protein [Anaerolineaceae bacterium]